MVKKEIIDMKTFNNLNYTGKKKSTKLSDTA